LYEPTPTQPRSSHLTSIHSFLHLSSPFVLSCPLLTFVHNDITLSIPPHSLTGAFLDNTAIDSNLAFITERFVVCSQNITQNTARNLPYDHCTREPNIVLNQIPSSQSHHPIPDSPFPFSVRGLAHSVHHHLVSVLITTTIPPVVEYYNLGKNNAERRRPRLQLRRRRRSPARSPLRSLSLHSFLSTSYTFLPTHQTTRLCRLPSLHRLPSVHPYATLVYLTTATPSSLLLFIDNQASEGSRRSASENRPYAPSDIVFRIT